MNIPGKLEELGQPELAQFVTDVVRRTALHYGIWFNEVVHQLGLEEAIRAEEEVAKVFFPVITKRLGGTLGVDAKTGLSGLIAGLPREKLIGLADAMSANWLAGDGIWFQAVEGKHGMNAAKRANDTCWTRFSPVEAHMIKSILKLAENPGLEGLQKALAFRLYARINVQAADLTGEGLVFKMLNCRVQEARKRKGLEDYPCKSAGLVEYESFARTIDPRIKTECIACPPDKHPAEWYCGWRFYIVHN